MQGMKKEQKQKIIVILGPNASGKSALAVEVARKFNGEIISADSRQVYKGMDIGTGKVPRDKINFKTSDVLQDVRRQYIYKNIPHYLLDVASPKRRFTVAQYKKLALAAIKKISNKKGYSHGRVRISRGQRPSERFSHAKIPIICGGTGFYIQAVTDNISIPEVKPDFKLRARFEKKSAVQLFSELKKRDPNRAKKIDRFNKRRLIRTLEIIYKTGKPVPQLKNELQFDTLFLGVKKSPQELKKLIHKRLIKRLRQGMIEEVKNLRNSGLSWKKLDDFGLEYRWIARFLQKKIDYQTMLFRLQKDIEHYAKRQMTWFSAHGGQDNRIHWIRNKKQAQKLINRFIKKY
ncbi:MAG: hypothetical protein AUJ32_02905 [Parcubacteria group bacterium CG1_02_40_82]|uniref:tRNA dimethylallyltransferase n=2 Tax=Candidatus Portnoyibacteriota TaxID=1817913 RepID=A0A2H0KRS7_9BACT|nr:MAG: hypothetical protein AUJ32_02905 [Parcubacteria group bacterium CG1_02_40_82]PIQ74863.1 MAG: hypothetical protein COV84_04330 [Candidatus Portnoybacteria bacterium CG11_big_fil_rev_8_21_14_0_20_40_15]